MTEAAGASFAGPCARLWFKTSSQLQVVAVYKSRGTSSTHAIAQTVSCRGCITATAKVLSRSHSEVHETHNF